MSGPALLQLASEIDSTVAEVFHRWCDAHARVDLALPGFLSARRLLRSESWAGAGVSMPCLTIYELDDLTALTSEAYQKHDQSMPEEFKGHLRFERSVFQEIESYPVKPEQSEGRAIFHVVTEVESGFEDEFDRWYAREHVPAVLTAPGVLSARRYLQVDDPAGKTPQPERYTCLAVYELDDAGVLTRPEAVRASRTASCPADLEPHRRVTHHVYEPFFSLPKD